LILTSNFVLAQYKPKLVDKYVKKLQQKGIDTILIFMNGSTWHFDKQSCNCLHSITIYAVYLIYQKNGKTYKTDFSCCKENDTVKIDKSLSIPYFLSLKEVFKKEDDFYVDLKSHKKFPPPMPTDNPFDEVEIITPKVHLEFSLDSYQSDEGYSIWKKYFWIDKEINLIALIKKDLMISSK
jgi:hypothetical protein